MPTIQEENEHELFGSAVETDFAQLLDLGDGALDDFDFGAIADAAPAGCPTHQTSK